MIIDEVYRVNIRRLMYKLQTALCHRGIYVKINQQQSYSEKSERMVTKYIVKIGTDTILETYHAVDVVMKLAEMLGGE